VTQVFAMGWLRTRNAGKIRLPKKRRGRANHGTGRLADHGCEDLERGERVAQSPPQSYLRGNRRRGASTDDAVGSRAAPGRSTSEFQPSLGKGNRRSSPKMPHLPGATPSPRPTCTHLTRQWGRKRDEAIAPMEPARTVGRVFSPLDEE
jgi:hypothetical protein